MSPLVVAQFVPDYELCCDRHACTTCTLYDVGGMCRRPAGTPSSPRHGRVWGEPTDWELSCAARFRIFRRDPAVPLQTPGYELIDYRAIFMEGSVAQAVSDLNGRFLDCNRMFASLTGCVF